MKNTITLLIAVMLLTIACKKDGQDTKQESSLARKYAKFSAPVYKNSDLKEWMATLAKAEPVELLEVTEATIKNKTKELARVRLSDGLTGFLDMEHLADLPVVFIEDTRAHERNNATSRVYLTIPRATIAFIIAEKGEWSQIYAGQVQGKWLTRQWVRGGFSAEESVILEARTYEEAAAALDSDEATEQSRQEALANLAELASSSRAFGDLARKKLRESASQSGGPAESEEGSLDPLVNETGEER
jgi:lipoprotein LenA